MSGDFHLISILGIGGMGAGVYEVPDVTLGWREYLRGTGTQWWVPRGRRYSTKGSDLGGWETQYMLPYLDCLLHHNMGNSLSRGAGRQHRTVEKSMGRESHTSGVKSHLYHLTSNLGKIAKLFKP